MGTDIGGCTGRCPNEGHGSGIHTRPSSTGTRCDARPLPNQTLRAVRRPQLHCTKDDQGPLQLQRDSTTALMLPCRHVVRHLRARVGHVYACVGSCILGTDIGGCTGRCPNEGHGSGIHTRPSSTGTRCDARPLPNQTLRAVRRPQLHCTKDDQGPLQLQRDSSTALVLPCRQHMRHLRARVGHVHACVGGGRLREHVMPCATFRARHAASAPSHSITERNLRMDGAKRSLSTRLVVDCNCMKKLLLSALNMY